MKKYDIFISYSRKDFDEVNQIVEMLKSRIPTLNCWFDIMGIESGDEFEDKIIAAIDNSSYVLFALSDNSIQSIWTKKEVTYAQNTERKVIPLLLKGAKLKGWFLFNFGRIDCIDTTDSLQIEKLIKNLSDWTGKAIANESESSFSYTDESSYSKNTSISSTKQETKKENNQISSSKLHTIYNSEGNIEYVGEMKDGKYNGLGTLYFKDGGKYIGQFENGKRHGQGTFNYASGDKYEGSFKFNKIDGKGSFYYANGDKYIGTFKNNRKSGLGTLFFANGTKYKGEFENDLINGKGTFYDKDGKNYEGRFINGYYYSDDEFIEDQFNTENLYDESEIYNLSDSNKNKTKLTKENNKDQEADNLTIEEKYVGPLKDNKRHGMGTLYFSDGSKYEGQFEDDKFNGIGTYYFADGGKYIGQFVNGRFNGHGTNYFPDGSKYEGQFKDDKFNGQGIFYYASGNKYEGQFENGKRHGQGYYYVNGKKQSVNYNNGELIKQTPRKPRGILDFLFGK